MSFSNSNRLEIVKNIFNSASTSDQTINDVVTLGEKEINSKADIPALGKLFLRKEIYEQRPDLDFDRLNLLRQKKVSKTLNTPELKRELRKLEREYDKYLKQRRIREREARLKK